MEQNDGLDRRTLEQTCMALQRNDPTLTWIDTSFFSGPDIGLALGRSLAGNNCLKRVVLRNLKLSEAAARALGQGIRQSSLQILEFRGSLHGDEDDGIASEEAKRIRRLLYDGVGSSTTIQELKFVETHSEEMDGLNIILSDFRYLNTLKLDDLWLTEETAQLVARIIVDLHVSRLRARFHPFLRSDESRSIIDVHANQIRTWQILRAGLMASSSIRQLELVNLDQPDRWEDIFVRLHGLKLELSMLYFVQESEYSQLLHNILIRTSSLSHLSMKGICLDEADFVQFAEALRRNVSLTKLEVISCQLNSSTAREIVRAAIISHPRLRMLNFGDNDGIGFEGVQMITQDLRLHQSRLTHIGLSSCFGMQNYYGMNRRDRKMAIEHQAKKRDKTVLALLEFVKANHYIECLELEGSNRINDEDTKKILFYTTLNRLGRRLLSQDYGLASSVWTHVLAKCQTESELKYSLTYFFLREQPSLVQCYRDDAFTRNKRCRREI
jgi:hypothetical protein